MSQETKKKEILLVKDNSVFKSIYITAINQEISLKEGLVL